MTTRIIYPSTDRIQKSSATMLLLCCPKLDQSFTLGQRMETPTYAMTIRIE